MTTLAQKNLAAFRAIKRTHTVSVAGTALEISPPGLIEIVEKVSEDLGIDLSAVAAGGIDIVSLVRKFPGFARWLGVRSLASKTSDEEAAEIEEFVAGLAPDHLFELAEGIVSAIMPDLDASKKKLAALGGRLGLAAA